MDYRKPCWYRVCARVQLSAYREDFDKERLQRENALETSSAIGKSLKELEGENTELRQELNRMTSQLQNMGVMEVSANNNKKKRVSKLDGHFSYSLSL